MAQPYEDEEIFGVPGVVNLYTSPMEEVTQFKVGQLVESISFSAGIVSAVKAMGRVVEVLLPPPTENAAQAEDAGHRKPQRYTMWAGAVRLIDPEPFLLDDGQANRVALMNDAGHHVTPLATIGGYIFLLAEKDQRVIMRSSDQDEM